MANFDRFCDRKAIKGVFDKKQTIHSNTFTIFYLANPLLVKKNRILYIVSKKVSNKATVRNKIKRQLKAMAYASSFLDQPLFDVIVLVKKSYLDSNYQQNFTQINRLFKKIGIISKTKHGGNRV